MKKKRLRDVQDFKLISKIFKIRNIFDYRWHQRGILLYPSECFVFFKFSTMGAFITVKLLSFPCKLLSKAMYTQNGSYLHS